MSPSAIAFTTLFGTMFTSRSMPEATGAAAAGAPLACAPSAARSSGSRPRPGCTQFTSVTPISTAIDETIAV